MNKNASDLLRLALLGMLTGGGAYSALRLGHDIPQALSGEKQHKNQLNVTLPSARMPELPQQKMANMAEDPASMGKYLYPALAYGGGLGGGFLGASALYQHLKKKQIENQTKGIEQNYLAALQQAHQKTASTATPNVDKFITGMLSKIGELARKEAMFGVNPPTTSMLDNAGHMAGNAMSSIGSTEVGSAVKAALVASMLGAGGLTYWINKNHERQKEENKAQTSLPTDVRLNIAH